MKNKDGTTYMSKNSGNDVTVHVFPASFHTAMELFGVGAIIFFIFLGLAACIHGWPFGS